MNPTKSHPQETARGQRFAFGANWARFLSTLDGQRIEEAQRSLLQMLELPGLAGRSFLDIGCGSGLFSLAARRLGARVHSFDYDPQSVACARQLKQHFYPQDASWTIEEGSVLDEEYMKSLGQFDIVYSWGVLHHTGNLKKALEHAALPVASGGLLYIAIYNDQGALSRFWAAIKRTYCTSRVGQWFILLTFIPLFALRSVVVGLVKYRSPLGEFVNYKKKRGMSLYHDWVDWLGGYPFEVAKPEDIFRFYRDRGYSLRNLATTNRLGCNQFVFQRH